MHHGTGTTAIVIVRRFVVKSLLFTCSGSVRVRLGLGRGLGLGLQLGMGI